MWDWLLVLVEGGDGNLHLLQVWLDYCCYDDCVCGKDLNRYICFGSFNLDDYYLWEWWVLDDDVVMRINRLTLVSCVKGVSRKKSIIVFERVLCYLRWDFEFPCFKEETRECGRWVHYDIHSWLCIVVKIFVRELQ